MADQRCPMCGKRNSAEAAACASCGARLKPLGTPSPTPPEEGGAGWMDDLRGDMMRNRPKTSMLPPEPPRPEPSGDWLSRLQPGDSSKEAEPPVPPEPPRKGLSSRIGTGRVPSAPEPPARTGTGRIPPAPEPPGPSGGGRTGAMPPVQPPSSPPPSGPASQEEPPWLKRLRVRRSQEDLASTPPAPPSPPAEESAESAGLPDWLSRIRDKSAGETDQSGQGEDQSYLYSPIPPAAAPPVQPGGGYAPWAEGGPQSPPAPTEPLVHRQDSMPDWLQPPPGGQSPAEGKTSTPAMPDWLSPFAQPDLPSPEPPRPAAPPTRDLPKQRGSRPLGRTGKPAESPASGAALGAEWQMVTGQPGGGEPTSGGALGGDISAFSAGTEPMVAPGGDEELPDWLADAQTGTAPGETMEPEPEEPIAPTPDIGELLRPDAMDWMQRKPGGEAAPEQAAAPAAHGQENLEQADLPRWLEAMRPIQAVGVSEEDDDRVESVGPLAGLRGVLSAEPVVAMPRRPGILAGNIDATPAQQAAADLLRRLVIEPEVRAARRLSRPMSLMPALRKIIAVLILLAVLLPAAGLNAVFSPPGALPPASLNAGALVESLPADRPVLVAFEYDASSAPELEAGATALLGHLARRGIPVAVISTKPNGATLGEGLLTSPLPSGLAMPPAMKNFGYVPGGASGLRALASNLHSTLGLDETEWSKGPLAGLSGVADFSMILVIAAQPQTVRDWVEQVHTAAPGTPMVAVVSAAADALVYPYTQGTRPSLAGMIAGYTGAQAYGAQFLQDNAAYSGADYRWQAFGMASLFSVLILLTGAVVSIVAIGLRRNRRTAE